MPSTRRLFGRGRVGGGGSFVAIARMMQETPCQHAPMADRPVIATRESRLALWQAEHVKGLLERRLGAECHAPADDQPAATRSSTARSLKVGGKGLCSIKELENALEDGRADSRCISLKDVPMDLPAGFGPSRRCSSARTPADAFVSVSARWLAPAAGAWSAPRACAAWRSFARASPRPPIE